MLKSLSNLQRLFADHPLTCDAPLGAWFRFVKWQVRSRIQSEILHDWVGGQKLAVRHGMTGATGNVYVGLHEFFDMMVPLHFLRRGDLFLDVGANVGTYTVLASGVCGASTFAFEPDPNTASRLRRNIELNSLGDRVEVYECALGAERGNAPFTVGLDTVNRIASSGGSGTRSVRMETLDDIVRDAPPAMMKIDVEGWELEVLSGAGRVLGNPALRVIELETVVSDCAAILAHYGFERASYNPFHRTLGKHPDDCKSSNSLFVRDWHSVAERLQAAEPVEILGRAI